MSEDRFQTLNEKIDSLIVLCAELRKENQLLKATSQNWAVERQQLLEKNRQTRARLESILARLRAMEEA